MNINTFTHALVTGKDEALKLEHMLVDALRYAESNGLVATIERKAVIGTPLAQGNHEPTIVISAVKEFGMKLEAQAKSIAEALNTHAIETAAANIATEAKNEGIAAIHAVESVGSEIAAAIKKDF